MSAVRRLSRDIIDVLANLHARWADAFSAWIMPALAGGALVLAGGVGLAAGGAVPSPPSDVIAGKAYSALERSCAVCHQKELLPAGTRAGGGLSNILALGELARMPGVVRPGLPDASRLYNVALTQEKHLDVFNDPAVPEPMPDEIQAIRDWISELPDTRCTPVGVSSGDELGRAMVQALASLPPETARLARFVSVRHMAERCAGPAAVERVKEALSDAVRSRTGASLPIEPVDPGGQVWRVSLRQLGLAPVAWEKLVRGYPLGAPPGLVIPDKVRAATGAAVPLLPGDWLVEVLARGLESGAVRGSRADLSALAAELWLPEDDVRERLSRAPAGLTLAVRRLASGDAIERDEADRVGAYLAGRGVLPAAAGPGDLTLALWSDKTVYAAGETGELSAVANRDCYLTLIGVDRAGRATVLFPNEMEPANRIAAGEVRKVPGDKAGYRFRFSDKGREHVVGVCSETHKTPEGVVHDYERLRFTVLGDWQLFLREPPELAEARRDDAAMDVPRAKPRERRRGRAVDPGAGASVEAADVQTRTAITIEVR